jgi:hypothetical protein
MALRLAAHSYTEIVLIARPAEWGSCGAGGPCPSRQSLLAQVLS